MYDIAIIEELTYLVFIIISRITESDYIKLYLNFSANRIKNSSLCHVNEIDEIMR